MPSPNGFYIGQRSSLSINAEFATCGEAPKAAGKFKDDLRWNPATASLVTFSQVFELFASQHLCSSQFLNASPLFVMNYVFAFVFGIGLASGLRALTPVALVTWAAHLGWLNLSNSPLAFMGSIITVVIFSLLAVFELIQDPLPKTPKRTAPVPLGARILTGGLCGTCLCAAGSQPLIIGAILGGVGAIIGTFAGYEVRRRLVGALNVKDIFVALLEDLVTIGLAYFFVSR